MSRNLTISGWLDGMVTADLRLGGVRSSGEGRIGPAGPVDRSYLGSDLDARVDDRVDIGFQLELKVAELLLRTQERVNAGAALHRTANDRAVFDGEVMGAVHVHPPVQRFAVEELNPRIGGPVTAAGERRFLPLWPGQGCPPTSRPAC